MSFVCGFVRWLSFIIAIPSRAQLLKQCLLCFHANPFSMAIETTRSLTLIGQIGPDGRFLCSFTNSCSYFLTVNANIPMFKITMQMR